MDDIINQIIQIDMSAYDNKTKNEQVLKNKKQEYENIISNYRNEKIALAKHNADLINKDIEAELAKQEDLNNEKIKKISIGVEARYLHSEEELIQKIFNKLFVMEG